ncbi:MAG TPA: ribbon-helix-helix protein, CopG family [Micromonosporaceae bacterium]
MPRPGPPKPTITIRLHQAGIDWLDQLAREQNTTRSDLIRKMIATMIAKEGKRP